MLNIGDRAYVGIDFTSLDTESTALDKYLLNI